MMQPISCTDQCPFAGHEYQGWQLLQLDPLAAAAWQ